MPKSRAVGIDLGTTYSAAAWIDDAGHSELIPNEEGDLLTPSVVLFDDDQVVVGKEAKKVAVADADRVAICVKRDMGKPVYSKPIKGQYLPPEVIQSYILRKIRRDIVRKLGPDFHVVITVPAYFDEPRRTATYRAGELAGLNVLDILNEPTAAALAYGEEQGYLTRFGAPKERMRVVVYDLGGGTFDITLIDMQPGDLKTLCTDGDMQLGGHDWDMRLVDYLSAAFLKEFGDDPRQSASSLQRMLVAAEEGKHTLSVRPRAKIMVSHNGRAMEVPVTREQFEEMSTDLMERTRYTTRRLLIASGFEWKNIQRLLLTGGSTRMPMVQRMLKELTGLEPDMSISPDEAVARGAAIYAQYLLASKGETGHKPTFDVTNVNAHSLGIKGTDPETGRKRNKVLIPRNTPLPAKKTTRCVTKKAGQDSVVVEVLEGESLDPKECSAIGKTVIRDLPPSLPKGWPIDVTYEYGVNGRLHVVAKVRGTDKEVHLELERDEAMSADRLSRWKGALDAEGGLDAFDLAIMQELEELKKHAPQPSRKPAPTSAPHTAAAPPAPQPSPGAGQAKQSSVSAPNASTTPAVQSPQPAPAPSRVTRVSSAPQMPPPASPQPTAPVAPQPAAVTPTPITPTPITPAPAQMPTVAFTCPHCRGVFHVPAALAGQQTNCPGCRGALIVPNVARQVFPIPTVTPPGAPAFAHSQGDEFASLFEAITNGDVRTVTILTTKRSAGRTNAASKKNDNGDTPLHCAINSAITGATGQPGWGGKTMLKEDNYPRIIQILLENGADPNCPDNNGFTPLLLAARVGFASAVKLLTASGANLQACLPDGNNSLHLAALNDAGDVIDVLLRSGMNVNARNGAGNTALNIAVSCGFAASVKLLLDRGADPNIPNNSEYYPLHWAAHKNNVAIARMLIANGADPNARDDRGTTPLDEARKQRHSEMVALLNTSHKRRGN